MKKFIGDLNSFYPEYLHAHANKTNRLLHFIGTSLFLGLAFLSLLFHVWWLILAAIFCGYFFAGIGHRYLEHNESFRKKKAVACVISSGRMYLDTITFRVNKKMRMP